MFQPLSSLWGPLLGAVWCHSVPGVARLLQRLPELRVGHRGWTRKLHQDQFWQVCMTVLQQLSCGEENKMDLLTDSLKIPHFVCFFFKCFKMSSFTPLFCWRNHAKYSNLICKASLLLSVKGNKERHSLKLMRSYELTLLDMWPSSPWKLLHVIDSDIESQGDITCVMWMPSADHRSIPWQMSTELIDPLLLQ